MSKLRFKCIKVYPNGPDFGMTAVHTGKNITQRFFECEEEPETWPQIEDPECFPDNWELVEEANVINGVEFTLRDNADIVALAFEAAKSLDSTELKLYFKHKLNLK